MKKLTFLFLIFGWAFAQAQVQFKSGKTDFEFFLKENTIYPSFSKHNCIVGTVNVSFKLNKNGRVYYAKVTQGIGTDLDDEALRLIRLSSGKWNVPTGFDTTAVIVVPINFVLEGYNCESKSKEDIKSAINAYQSELGLMDAVVNFYKHKEEATPEQEQKIMNIKNQLGIDDDYLNERINDGLNKIKQGDMQAACNDFNFVKNMNSDKADAYLQKYCK